MRDILSNIYKALFTGMFPFACCRYQFVRDCSYVPYLYACVPY